jgi:hypothetical protein
METRQQHTATAHRQRAKNHDDEEIGKRKHDGQRQRGAREQTEERAPANDGGLFVGTCWIAVDAGR